MRAIFLVSALAVAVFGDIKIKEADFQKSGIVVKPATISKYETAGAFFGVVAFDETGVFSYSLPSSANVVKSLKKEGDEVKKGELLCVVSSTELMGAAFELRELKNRLNILTSNFSKDKEAYEAGAISARELQKSSLEKAAVETKVKELSSRLQISNAKLVSSGLFEIYAQKDGVVSLAPAKIGGKIEPFEPFFTTFYAKKLSAKISVPKKFVSLVKKGSLVTSEDKNVIGNVTSVSAHIDEHSASASVLARLTVKNDSLKAGVSGRFFILTDRVAAVVSLPTSAIIKYKNKDVCFVRTKDGFAPKEINILSQNANTVFVSQKELPADTKVAVSGVLSLKGALSGMGFE